MTPEVRRIETNDDADAFARRLQAAEFFAAFTQDLGSDWLEISTIPPGGGSLRSFPFQVRSAEEFWRAVDHVMEVAQTENAYVCRCPLSRPPSGRRASAGDIAGMTGLFLDIDAREGRHARSDLPATGAEGLAALLSAGFPVPSMAAHTGGGLHVHWLLKQRFSPSEGATIARAWHERARAVFQARGWHLDATFDLPRLVRIPGTFNRKPGNGEPRPVRLSGPSSWRRIDPPAIEGASVDPSHTKPESWRGVRGLVERQRKADLEKLGPPDAAPILVGCDWLRHLDENPERQTEPEWYAALSILARCRDGEKVADAFSNGHPGYNPEKVRAKAAQALTASGPTTCASVGAMTDACGTCPFKGTITSPIALGYAKESVVRAQREVVFVEEQALFVERSTGKVWSQDVLKAQLQVDLGPKAVNRLLSSRTTPRVRRMDYLPGQPIIGDGVANRWRRGGAAPNPEGDPTVLVDFVGRLIVEPVARNALLDALAHRLQRPGEKVRWAAMLISETQGTGKGTLGRIVRRLLGDGNARVVGGEALASTYRASLTDCEVLIVEEANHGERFEVYNSVKTLVTDDTMTVHEKYMPQWEGRTPRFIILNTNFSNGIAIPNTDRRFMITACREAKMSDDEKREVNAAIADDATVGAFTSWLMARDLSAFEPWSEAPVTEARAQSVKASATPLAQIVAELMESGKGCFGGDLATIEDVRRTLSAYASGWLGSTRMTPNRVGNALKEVGAVNLGQKRVQEGSGKVVVWALRNGERWADAKEGELREAYQVERSGGAPPRPLSAVA